MTLVKILILLHNIYLYFFIYYILYIYYTHQLPPHQHQQKDPPDFRADGDVCLVNRSSVVLLQGSLASEARPSRWFFTHMDPTSWCLERS